MTKHLQIELDKLKRKLVLMANKVNESLLNSVKALSNNDVALANRVIDEDFEIDQLEVEIEEDCLKILALYQPVAIDLRFVITMLKINNELERIGDLAVNISERCLNLQEAHKVLFTTELDEMTKHACAMVRNSIDSIIDRNASLAWEVIKSDDKIDLLYKKIFTSTVKTLVNASGEQAINSQISLLSVARYLERVGDHATNIAEDVIYMLEARIVRHTPETFSKLK